MADPITYHFILPSKGRPEPFALSEAIYPGVQSYMDLRSKKRSGHPINSVTTIVIHATAGGSSSGAMSVMEKGEVKIGTKIKKVNNSWHWLIPDENEDQHGKFAWACVFEALAANHVLGSKKHPDVNGGKSGLNNVSLGIEIVNTQTSDPFSEWQVKMAAEVVRYCWAKYPNLVDVVSHAKLNPDRRTDPGKDFPWNDFKALVLDDQTTKGKLAAFGVLPPVILPDQSCCMAHDD